MVVTCYSQTRSPAEPTHILAACSQPKCPRTSACTYTRVKLESGDTVHEQRTLKHGGGGGGRETYTSAKCERICRSL